MPHFSGTQNCGSYPLTNLYSSALDRAQAIAKKFFVALKPSLTLDPSDGKITVAVGIEPGARLGAVPLFTDVLNGIERLAAEDGRPALVVGDEFQQGVAEAGQKAERQIRAACRSTGRSATCSRVRAHG